MKTAVGCCAALLVALIAFPAQASADLVPYDDFEAEGIDQDKWSGTQSGILLDVGRETDGPRGFRKLRLVASAFGLFGSTVPDVGDSLGRVRLLFTNPSAVTTIEAKVEVREVEATGCPGNLTPTRAQTRISGFFFKSAAVTPPSGINDVLAFVRIERSSNTDDPEGMLRVLGVVFHCADPDCFAGTVLNPGNTDLGTIMKKEVTTLRIEWDQLNHRFIFQRDDQPEVIAPYDVADELPPDIVQKRLEIAHQVANCTATPTTPRPAAFMEARFDDVAVNP